MSADCYVHEYTHLVSFPDWHKHKGHSGIYLGSWFLLRLQSWKVVPVATGRRRPDTISLEGVCYCEQCATRKAILHIVQTLGQSQRCVRAHQESLYRVQGLRHTPTNPCRNTSWTVFISKWWWRNGPLVSEQTRERLERKVLPLNCSPPSGRAAIPCSEGLRASADNSNNDRQNIHSSAKSHGWSSTGRWGQRASMVLEIHQPEGEILNTFTTHVPSALDLVTTNQLS